MTPIALYPSDSSHKKSFGVGGFCLFMAYQVYSWAPDAAGWTPAVLAMVGVGVIAQTAWRKANPKPSFEADQAGFSVMGKPKRTWDEFRGVSVHSIRVGIFPVAQRLSIKTGKSILGGSIPINFTHLSGPAKDMATEIQAYGQHAKRKDDLVEAMSAIPATPLTGRMEEPAGRRRADPMPTAAFTPSMPDDQAGVAAMRAPKRHVVRVGAGPVESVPKMSERLFGRRKVI